MDMASLRDLLRQWDHHGFLAHPNGALLWGRRPDGVVSGVLHKIHPPYPDAVLGPFLQENAFLAAYVQPRLWRSFNSSSLYGYKLKFYGPRLIAPEERPIEAIDVVSTNLSFADVADRHGGTIVGSAEGAKYNAFLVERPDGPVVSVCREDDVVLAEWSGLEACILATVTTMNAHFDPEAPSAYVPPWVKG